MKMTVYGAGAVGGGLAARLALSGHDVSVIARGPHGRAMRESGLTLLAGERRDTVRVTCVENPANLPPQDVVFVTVKSHQLPAIAQPLVRLAKRDAPLVFVMNGIPWWFAEGLPVEMPAWMAARLDPGGELARYIALDRVVMGVVHSGNEVIEPGVVRNTTFDRNRLILGTPKPDSPVDVGAIVRLVDAPEYHAHASDAIRQDLWQKMVLVVGISSAAALSDSDLGVLANDAEAAALLLDLMCECAAIGEALGFTIPDDHAQRIRYFRDKRARPSLQQDFIARREPELDATILAFVALADAAGVAVPKLRTVATLVRLRAEALGLRRAYAPDGAKAS